MSGHSVRKGFVLAFLLLLGGGGVLKLIASSVQVEVVIAGEVDRQTGRVRITDGELGRRSFGSVASAMDAMKRAGYQPQSVDQLRTALESGIEELKKGDPLVVVITRGRAGTVNIPTDEKTSLVEIERKDERSFSFKVLTGSLDEIRRQYDLDKCEKMNEKCFICPDKKIRCKIEPITK